MRQFTVAEPEIEAQMREAIDERPDGPDALSGLARRLIDEFAGVGAKLRGYTDVDEVLADLSHACRRLVPHAEHASTSRRERRGFVTIGATSNVPPRVDRIQYDELGHGPCVDAILTDNLFNTGDLRTDPRWPDFGRRAAEETGILSMLSFRLFYEDVGSAELMAALNLYAAKPHAFDELDESVLGLVATHGALAVSAAQQRQRADGVTTALQSNRDIGAAMGVLMSHLLITREQAFDLMRIASQRTNRKLRDIADEVLETGSLAFLEQPQPIRDRAGARSGGPRATDPGPLPGRGGWPGRAGGGRTGASSCGPPAPPRPYGS